MKTTEQVWEVLKEKYGVSDEDMAQFKDCVHQEKLEMTLVEVRKASGLFQKEVAYNMGWMNRSNLSHFERRKNRKFSTLRSYVEALGGKLEAIVTLGDKTIRLSDV